MFRLTALSLIRDARDSRVCPIRTTRESSPLPSFQSASYRSCSPRVCPSCTELADYLTEQAARGRFTIPDTQIAADQFYGALLGGIHFRHVLGVEKGAAPGEVAARVDTVVNGFLATYDRR